MKFFGKIFVVFLLSLFLATGIVLAQDGATLQTSTTIDGTTYYFNDIVGLILEPNYDLSGNGYIDATDKLILLGFFKSLKTQEGSTINDTNVIFDLDDNQAIDSRDIKVLRRFESKQKRAWGKKAMGAADVKTILQNWIEVQRPETAGDVNEDGVIDNYDAYIIRDFYKLVRRNRNTVRNLGTTTEIINPDWVQEFDVDDSEVIDTDDLGVAVDFYKLIRQNRNQSTVNDADLKPGIQEYVSDLNGDSVTNKTDILLFKIFYKNIRNHYKTETGQENFNATYDINEDGRVDILDKRMLRDFYKFMRVQANYKYASQGGFNYYLAEIKSEVTQENPSYDLGFNGEVDYMDLMVYKKYLSDFKAVYRDVRPNTEVEETEDFTRTSSLGCELSEENIGVWDTCEPVNCSVPRYPATELECTVEQLDDGSWLFSWKDAGACDDAAAANAQVSCTRTVTSDESYEDWGDTVYFDLNDNNIIDASDKKILYNYYKGLKRAIKEVLNANKIK